MKHICEICGKQYDTVIGAEQCEVTHKKNDTEKQMVEASAKINDSINAYVAKYKELPDLGITAANQRILFGSLEDTIVELLGKIIDVLYEEDESDDECNCKKASAKQGVIYDFYS